MQQLPTIRHIIKDTAFYGLLLALNQMLNYILLPLYTARTNEMGFTVFSLFFIFKIVFAALFMMGTDTAVMRFSADAQTRDEKRSILTNGFFIIAAAAILIFTGAYFLQPAVFAKYQLEKSYIHAYYYLMGWGLAGTLNQLMRNWYRWQFMRKAFMWNVLSFFVLNIACTWYFLGHRDNAVEAIFLAGLVSEGIVCMAGIVFSYREFSMKINTGLIKQMFWYAFPFLIIMLLSALTPSLDRLFLVNAKLPSLQIAEYMFAFRVSSIVNFVFIAFFTAFTPYIMKTWNHADAPASFAKMQTIFAGIISGLALALCCCSNGLVHILGNGKYPGAARFLPWLNLSFVIYSMMVFSFIGFSYARKSRYNLLATLLNVGVCYLLNVFLTPVFLQYGAVTAVIVANLAMNIAAYMIGQRLYRIPFNFLRDGIIIFTGFILSMVSGYILFPGLVRDGIIKLVLFLPLFILFIYLILPFKVSTKSFFPR
jgi:O-antigen/teichoic acid export membrane protein